MESEMKDARSAGQSIDRKSIELNQLEREVTINRQLYETFLARNKEIAASSDFQQPAARLVDPALVPSAPTRPPMPMIALFGALIGGFAGLLGILIRDRLRNTLRTTDDVETRLNEPLLAAVPQIAPADAARAGRHFMKEPDSLFAEAIRTAATGVSLVNMESANSVIAVGSALDNEGKTTIACNLAVALSSSRRVLLIDADLHRPSVGTSLGLDSSRPGLSQLLDGRAQVEETLQAVPGTMLTVLPAGRIPGNALDLLMSERFRHLIGDLQHRYDLIILDTPPTQLVADTMILGRVATGMVMVVRSDRTPLPVVRRALNRVKSSGITLLGVVLNAHDFKRADRYYGENSGYKDLGYRYGYGATEKADQKRRSSRAKETAVS
jgi:capsular exopolysaccharide synthesis family protein